MAGLGAEDQLFEIYQILEIFITLLYYSLIRTECKMKTTVHILGKNTLILEHM